MFGKQKVNKDVAESPLAIPTAPETPDLVVERPAANMGMPGFVEDPVAPEPAPVAAPVAPVVAPVAPAPVAPAPVAPVVKDEYQIVGAEMLPEGLFRYVIVTNKHLGEVGGVYPL